MSSESNAQQDPSMEEILASIRRIISEGDEEGASEEGAEAQVSEEAPPEEAEAAAPEEAEPAAPEEDVLELTDVVEDDEPAADTGDIEVDLIEDEEAAEELGEYQADEVEIEPEGEEAQGGALTTDPDRLVSDDAAAVSSDAFAELAQSVAAAEIRHDTSPRIAHGGERTLEDVVREALRPLLKDWLDKNLPSLVHHLVKKEIERLSRR